MYSIVLNAFRGTIISVAVGTISLISLTFCPLHFSARISSNPVGSSFRSHPSDTCRDIIRSLASTS